MAGDLIPRLLQYEGGIAVTGVGLYVGIPSAGDISTEHASREHDESKKAHMAAAYQVQFAPLWNHVRGARKN